MHSVPDAPPPRRRSRKIRLALVASGLAISSFAGFLLAPAREAGDSLRIVFETLKTNDMGGAYACFSISNRTHQDVVYTYYPPQINSNGHWLPLPDISHFVHRVDAGKTMTAYAVIPLDTSSWRLAVHCARLPTRTQNWQYRLRQAATALIHGDSPSWRGYAPFSVRTNYYVEFPR